MPEPMDDDKLRAIVEAKIQNSVGFMGGRLARERVEADQYYNGEPFGNEVEGRSQVVDRVVAESIDGMMPSIMRIFASGDETVCFEPTKPGTEEQAAQATDYVNWIWNQQNPGYLIFYSWFKDALHKRLGTIKIWWNDQVDVTRETYNGLTEQEYQILLADDEVEIVKESTTPDPSWQPPPPEMMQAMAMLGQPVPAQPMLYDCKVKRTRQAARIAIMAVPPDEFLVDRRAVDLDELPFLCHRAKKPISDLIEMGFDRKVLEDLPGDDGEGDYDMERIERFHREDETPYRTDAEMDPSMREVWVYESYLKVDFDGDGVAEYRKVVTAGSNGSTLLANDEIDDHPFAALTPIILPHKLFGMSVADQTKDLQLVKSTVLRQMLDNLYLTNAPMREVNISGGKVNLDDLLTVRSGGVVRTQGEVGTMIREMAVPFTAGASFPMLEYFDAMREKRTGAAMGAGALDANILNSGATGANIANNTRLERVELIARTFAETGVRRAFRRILELVCKHQQKPRMVRLRGKWVPMDPREWATEMDMTVKVGLGTGDRTQQAMVVMQLLGVSKQLIELQGGLQGPFITAQNLYAQVKEFIRSAGLKSHESYISDPTGAPPSPPKPDPEMTKLQGTMAIEKQRAEHEMQLAQQRAEHEFVLAKQQAGQRAELERMQAEADMATERAKVEAQIELARWKAGLEASVAMGTASMGLPA